MFPDNYYPIATTIGLLKTDLKAAVESFAAWQNSLLRPLNKHIEASPYEGDLVGLIQSLHPLEISGHSRFAFVSTPSPWIAYFDNSGTGTQAATVAPVMAERLCCEAMRVAMIRRGIAGSPYPATIFEYYQSGMTPCRTIFTAKDGGKWSFGQSGAPLTFEESEKYSEKRVSDRFTPEMLQRFLLHLGLRPFDPDWYAPSRAWTLRKTNA
jgi:hypothetical protein